MVLSKSNGRKNRVIASTADVPQRIVRPTVASGKGFISNAYSMSTGTPEIRDPLYNPESFYVTYADLKTMNRWIRHYMTYHPILPNSIDIHSFFPISDFSFKGVTDPYVLEFYTWIKEDVLNLLNWVIHISKEYEMLGEGFTFFGWDSYEGIYNTATILNPDILDIYGFDFGAGDRRFAISMEIPEAFQYLRDKKDIDSRYQKMWMSLDPVIRRCVEGGMKIPLNPSNVFGLQSLLSPYDCRGTSQIRRVLKDLMYEDKLREAQMAVADGHITPVRLWKIGNSSTGYVPSQADLDDWNALLNQAEHQNLFRFVTHADVSYETKGISEGLLNITEEMKTIEDRLLTALYTSRAMTTGDGPTYSNAVIALKVLEGRYQNKLYRIAAVIRQLFTKIAEVHDFYSITPAELSHGIRKSKTDRKLMLPTVHWENYFSFSKDIERAKFYLSLAQAHKISYRRVLEILGLDFDEEQLIMNKDLKSIFESPIYEKTMKALTGDQGNGVPTNFDAPPSSGSDRPPLEDAGAEIPAGASNPPLPTIDI